MKKIIAPIVALLICAAAAATVPHKPQIPDIEGYKTLLGDFHVHTVFSDASTWPTTRVAEAAYDGLDILAITDHCETRHKKMIKKGYFNPEKVNQNTSYELAKAEGKSRKVLVLHGAEVTTGLRLFAGHFNVHFISDGVALANEEEKENGKIKDDIKREETALLNGLREARRQGAFITYNHPDWAPQSPEGAKWLPIHEKIYKEGLMDGIEIENHSVGFCPEAFHWAIEKNLTVVSGTDCHQDMMDLVDYEKGEYRSYTLVFAKEKTEASIREALDARRTAVYADDKFYGREEVLRPLFNASVKFGKIKQSPGKVKFSVTNKSSVPIYLERVDGSGIVADRFIKLNANETMNFYFYAPKGVKAFGKSSVEVSYKVMNYLTDVDKPLVHTFHFDINE